MTQYFPANPSLGINRLYGWWPGRPSNPTSHRGSRIPAGSRGPVQLDTGRQLQQGLHDGGRWGSHVDKYHSRYDTFIANGIEPGVVPNGYIRDRGRASLDRFRHRQRQRSDQRKLAAEQRRLRDGSGRHAVFPDNAQQVSNTIPAVMTAGASCTVSITVKNNSFMAWDSTNYKLGAVDDSDPFAGGRQLIANGVTVNPGQQYTFTFTMTVPTTPGTYTTDWRMVQENVNWFGDTLTKQVQVLNASPPEPVTNLTAAPALHQILLSWTNPSSANFTGTMIRYSTSGYPANPSAGSLLIDQPNAPGTPAASCTPAWPATPLLLRLVCPQWPAGLFLLRHGQRGPDLVGRF